MGGGSTGSSGKRGKGGDIKVLKEQDLISLRESQQKEVDDTLSVFKDVNNKYGYVVDDLKVVTLSKKDSDTMAYFSNGEISINKTYFTDKAVTGAYDGCVKSGFHPSRGNKTAMQALVAHEVGHAISAKCADKMDFGNTTKTVRSLPENGKLHIASIDIVKEAMTKTSHKTVDDFAKKISGYARTNSAETVAEAFCDVYCNGNKAKRESRLVMEVVNKYMNK